MPQASPANPAPPDDHTLVETVMQAESRLLVVTDHTGRLLRCNAAATRFLGRPADDLIGRAVWTVLPTRSAAATLAFYQTLPDHLPPRHTVLTLRRHDGELRHLAWTHTPIPGPDGPTTHLLSSGLDITHHTHHRQDHHPTLSLSEQRDEYAHLLDLGEDALSIQTLDGRLRYLNPAATRLYGWSNDDARGHRLDALLRTTTPDPTGDPHHAVLSAGHWQGELTHTTRDGRLITVRSHRVLHHDPHGHPRAILQVDSDLTALIAAEHVREALLEQLARDHTTDQTLLQHLPVGLLVIDAATRRVTLANHRFERLLGREVPSGTTAARVLQHLHAAHGRPTTDLLHDVLTQARGLTDLDLTLIRPDGTPLPVWTHIEPIHDRLGRPTAVVLTTEPVAHRWRRALGVLHATPPPPVTPDTFTRRLGRLLGQHGHTPLEGRLIARLLLSPHPLRFTDAATSLGSSKGALSKAVHDLQDHGDLLVTRTPRTREHHLSLPDQTYLRDLIRWRDHSAALAGLLYALLRDTPDLPPDVTHRLRDLADLRARHALGLDALLTDRRQAWRRALETHLQDNWDAVAPSPPPDPPST